MLHFYPDTTVLGFFADEVAKLAAFDTELRKSANLAEKTVGELGEAAGKRLVKHLPAAAVGAGTLYLGNRALQNQRMGEAMRQQGGAF